MLDRSKRTVLLLASCQAITSTCITILVTVASLIGFALATNKALATLPITTMQLATMGATIPASLIMKQIGRQKGFMIGVGIGILGAAIASQAIFLGSFPLFCVGTVFMGTYNSFGWYYRFAAAEAAHESFRAQAISLVVAGGVIAAVIAPGLATWSKDWFQPAIFAGCFWVIIALQTIAILLLLGLRLPQLVEVKEQGEERSLRAIARQPVFIVAVLGSMMGYGIMSLVMTATPLAMKAIDHSFDSTASVIQWHVLGMFAPSFVTGFLIARFGVLNIILTGIGLNVMCGAINLSGTEVVNFATALLMLGIGWNFMFVGSTSLLTSAYRPAEKAKTQAVHDFLMFSFVALCSLMSGQLLYYFDWMVVNLVSLLAMAIALVANLWLRQQRKISPVQSDF